MTYRVAVADKVAEAGLKLLAATPEIEVANCARKTARRARAALAGAHALIVRSETRVTPDLLTRGPNLRVIARAGTGVDNIGRACRHAARHCRDERSRRQYRQRREACHGACCSPRPATFPGRGSDAARGVGSQAVRGDGAPWQDHRHRRIGPASAAHVAQHGPGVRDARVGHDPYLSPERATELQLKLLPLDQLLGQADVVTLHVAHTEQTPSPDQRRAAEAHETHGGAREYRAGRARGRGSPGRRDP